MGSPVSALAVELTWERPVGEIDSYIIACSPVNGPSTVNCNDTAEGNALRRVVGNLSPNTSYRFTLLAISNAYGRSLPSDPITLTTLLLSGKLH